MSRIIETEVFKYEELSDSAKESARNWYSENCLDYEWWDSVYEDFNQICELLGIELKNKNRGNRLRPDGSLAYEPEIWFRGFWSQGDGSSFAGSYEYKTGCAKAIREYAPRDKELHAIADGIAKGQRPLFYKASGRISTANRESSISVFLCDEFGNEYEGESYRNYAGHAGLIESAIQDLNSWLYRKLEKEYEYLTSDSAVAESIEANEYEFTKAGEII